MKDFEPVSRRRWEIDGACFEEADDMHVTDGSKKQWYYNSRTHQVEHGMLSSYEYRMGPYKTRQEAEKALELAKKRNEEWEASPIRKGMVRAQPMASATAPARAGTAKSQVAGTRPTTGRGAGSDSSPSLTFVEKNDFLAVIM